MIIVAHRQYHGKALPYSSLLAQIKELSFKQLLIEKACKDEKFKRKYSNFGKLEYYMVFNELLDIFISRKQERNFFYYATSLRPSRCPTSFESKKNMRLKLNVSAKGLIASKLLNDSTVPNDAERIYYLRCIHALWAWLIVNGLKQVENANGSCQKAINQPMIIKTTKNGMRPNEASKIFAMPKVKNALRKSPETRGICDNDDKLYAYFENLRHKLLGIVFCAKSYSNSKLSKQQKSQIEARYPFANEPKENKSIWKISKVIKFSEPMQDNGLKGQQSLISIDRKINPKLLKRFDRIIDSLSN